MRPVAGAFIWGEGRLSAFDADGTQCSSPVLCLCPGCEGRRRRVLSGVQECVCSLVCGLIRIGLVPPVVRGVQWPVYCDFLPGCSQAACVRERLVPVPPVPPVPPCNNPTNRGLLPEGVCSGHLWLLRFAQLSCPCRMGCMLLLVVVRQAGVLDCDTSTQHTPSCCSRLAGKGYARLAGQQRACMRTCRART